MGSDSGRSIRTGNSWFMKPADPVQLTALVNKYENDWFIF
jgi:hypothetical protein